VCVLSSRISPSPPLTARTEKVETNFPFLLACHPPPETAPPPHPFREVVLSIEGMGMGVWEGVEKRLPLAYTTHIL